jgi:hypothetical protein
LERVSGKPRELRPEEVEKARIDLSMLTDAELALLVKLAESGRLRASAPEPAPSAAEIDGVVATVGGHQ